MYGLPHTWETQQRLQPGSGLWSFGTPSLSLSILLSLHINLPNKNKSIRFKMQKTKDSEPVHANTLFYSNTIYN